MKRSLQTILAILSLVSSMTAGAYPTFDCTDEGDGPRTKNPEKIVQLGSKDDYWHPYTLSLRSRESPVASLDFSFHAEDSNINRLFIHSGRDWGNRYLVEPDAQLQPGKSYRFIASPAYEGGDGVVHVSAETLFSVAHSVSDKFAVVKPTDFLSGYIRHIGSWDVSYIQPVFPSITEHGMLQVRWHEGRILGEKYETSGTFVQCTTPEPNGGPPWHVHYFHCRVKMPTESISGGVANVRLVATDVTRPGNETTCSVQNYVETTDAHGKFVMVLDREKRVHIDPLIIK